MIEKQKLAQAYCRLRVSATLRLDNLNWISLSQLAMEKTLYLPTILLAKVTMNKIQGEATVLRLYNCDLWQARREEGGQSGQLPPHMCLFRTKCEAR